MKKIIILLILLNITFYSYSQEVDKVYLKNKEVVSGKILNVTPNNIEIDPVGSKPFIILKRDNVKLIIYSDNTIVSFDESIEKEGLNKAIINDDDNFNSKNFLDKRDGEEYKIGKFGNQIWMLENMRFENPGGFKAHRASYGKYKNVKIYGYLYYQSYLEGVCPQGWHIPSDMDWMELFNHFGGTTKKTSKALMNALNIQLARWYNSSKDYGSIELNDSGYYAIDDGAMYRFNNISKIKRLSFFRTGAKFYISCRCIKD